MGYMPTKHNPCFYVLRNEKGKLTVMLLVCVDDAIAAVDADEVGGASFEKLRATLKKKCGIDDRDNLEWY